MIQRLQSIFLFLAAVVIGLLLADFMYLIKVDDPVDVSIAKGQTMMADGLFTVDDHVILLIMTIVAALTSLLIIFLFRNRTLQIKLSQVVIVLLILIIVLSVFLFYNDYQYLSIGTEVTVGFGILSPIVAIFLVWLGWRYISKDEKLVRSADRLR